MAQIMILPVSIRSRPWPSRADTRPPDDRGRTLPSTVLAAIDTLLDGLRLAWWDGSALAFSRGGLEALVGMEPGDATPGRRTSAAPPEVTR